MSSKYCEHSIIFNHTRNGILCGLKALCYVPMRVLPKEAIFLDQQELKNKKKYSYQKCTKTAYFKNRKGFERIVLTRSTMKV